MSAINASEVLIEMIEKFIEIRKYIMNFKVTQAYELTKQQCLEYGKFKKGKTTTETTELDDKHDQVLKSVFAGLRLILFFLKIKTGITNIDNLDLKEVKSLIIEAFHRKEFLHVIRLASELLSQIFQSANYLSTSRVFLILAVESFQMINLNMKLTEDFLDELDLELIIPDQALLGAKLNAELQFLTKLFAVSRKNKKIKHSGNSERDISFYKILKEMQVKDNYEFPKLIKNYKDAKKLSNLIIPKLKEFQICIQSQNMDVQASLATQNQLMIKFWSGYTIHQVSNYQNDIDGKCILINESMEILNPLKTEQMTQQYLAEWSWIDTFIYAYRNLMESRISQCETLIDLKSKSILFATRSEVLPNIEKIDQLRLSIIKLIAEFIEFMDARPDEYFESNKYEYYWQVASHCRALVLEAEAKVYQKRSTFYIKRYVAALLENKDLRLEAQSFCEHSVNCQRCKDIMVHDADGKWHQKAMKRIDSHWFIEKFKKS